MQQEADYNNDEKSEYQLRQQMVAYQQLQRSSEAPLFPSKEWESERERIFNNSIRYFQDKIEKNEEFKSMLRERYNKRPAEPELIQDSSVFSERMASIAEKRRQEVEYEMRKTAHNEPKYLALKIELLFLNSKDFYCRVRDQILGPLLTEEQQAIAQGRLLERQLLDRAYFRRDKPTKKIESRLSDKFELNMIRHEQARRKKLKQKEFMHAVFAHQIEFFEFHRKKYKHARKRGAAVKVVLEQIENKKNQKHKQVLIDTLKEGDVEGYIKLLSEAKKKRVIQILQQTDKFLSDIGAKVKIQKGEEINKEDDEVINVNNEDGLAYDVGQSKRIYYNLTHKIQEQVTTQPLLLEGGELKSYQLQGLSWLVSLYNNNLNGILADEMGLGKTIQTISLLCFLIETKKNFGPFLIIVPLSTLSNWNNEFEKWSPSLKKLIYKGSPQERKDMAKLMKTSKWNVCLTTYEYVLKDKLALSKHEWKYIIVDEGHRMKNHKSKFAMILGQQYQSDRRLLLTGTPLQNNMAELWALLNFLLPKVFQSCEDFEKWFTMPLSKMGANEKDVDLDQEEQLLIINRLHQVLRPFLLRRVKKEVEKDLPRKIEYVIKISLSAWQHRIYNQLKDKAFNAFDQSSGQIGSLALQNLMMQLRKICNHPYLFTVNLDMTVVSDEIWRSSGKFELLDRILPKLLINNHRILIFSQMTQLMDILGCFFNYRNWKWLRLDGSTKSDDREARIKIFNSENSEYNIFLLSTRAGGLGLNLQSADTVILFDSDWNPMMDLQAQDRAYRIGQKNEVRVYRLITNTAIEKDILSKAEHKMGLDQVIIQAGLFNQRSTENERRERLQDYFSSKNRVQAFDEEEIPNDEQINEWIARTEAELEQYNELDRLRYESDKHIYKHFVQPNPDEQFRNYRLIQDDEVPEWITQKQVEPEEIKEYGRGCRQRKQVNNIIDENDSELEEVFVFIISNPTLNRKKIEMRSQMESQLRKRGSIEITLHQIYQQFYLSMNQDLNESKESAQSMERYLQNDQVSLSPAERVNVINQCKTASSILKLQNGKYSNQQTVFKEALDKKKLDLHKKTISQSSTKNLETKKFEKPIIKQDKVRDNIKAAKEFKKKEKVVKPPVYASIEQKPPAEEPDDAVFLEFVDRAYGHEKRRKQQIEKSAAEAQQKELDTIWTKPFINERSCKLLEKKLKQIVEVEEDYNKLYNFKEKQIQADLMPNLPKLRDALKMNCYAVKKQEAKEIEIIKEQNQNKEAVEQDMDAPQYKDTQVHQNCQTEEIKFRIGDTIKKSNLQEQQQQVAQFQIQDTPKKAVNNQRQKRLDIMESKVQTQRVKTECAYYVPIHERYNQVIDKKDKWIKQQVELKKQKEEEQYNSEMLNKSLHIEVDPEEFVNNQMSWLDKKNDHILTERIKKDKEMLTNLTFRPQISQKSNRIVNTSKVEDRLMDYQSKKIENLQKLENMYLPTFQPNLQAKQTIVSHHLSKNFSSKSFVNGSFNLWQ